MKRTKNSVSTKQLDKDIKRIIKETQKVATNSVAEVASQITSENAWHASFDDVESTPHEISGNTEGTIVVSANTDDPIAIDQLVTETATRALDALTRDVIRSMKGVLR